MLVGQRVTFVAGTDGCRPGLWYVKELLGKTVMLEQLSDLRTGEALTALAVPSQLLVYDPDAGKGNGEALLQEAARLISRDRNETYGSFYEEASKTTAITEEILKGSKIKWTQQQRFGLERVVHKLVRAGHSYKRDNFVDAAGYLELLNRMFENEQA